MVGAMYIECGYIIVFNMFKIRFSPIILDKTYWAKLLQNYRLVDDPHSSVYP